MIVFAYALIVAAFVGGAVYLVTTGHPVFAAALLIILCLINIETK